MADEIRVTERDATLLATPPRISPEEHGLPGAAEPSLGELFRDLAQETSTLMRQEVTLAKTEITQAATRVATDSVSLVVWAVVALLGGLTLLAAAVIGLGDLLDNYWLSALIIGGLLVLVGGLASMSYVKKLKSIDYSLSTTRDTLQADARWAKHEVQTVKQELTS